MPPVQRLSSIDRPRPRGGPHPPLRGTPIGVPKGTPIGLPKGTPIAIPKGNVIGVPTNIADPSRNFQVVHEVKVTLFLPFYCLDMSAPPPSSLKASSSRSVFLFFNPRNLVAQMLFINNN